MREVTREAIVAIVAIATSPIWVPVAIGACACMAVVVTDLEDGSRSSPWILVAILMASGAVSLAATYGLWWLVAG